MHDIARRKFPGHRACIGIDGVYAAIAASCVPKARVRTIMTAMHTRNELAQALEVLRKVGKRMGIIA